MGNTETQEMYLITIDKIRKEKGNVRLIDISRERGFTKSTTFAGLKKLEELELIAINDYHITLTSKGESEVENLMKKRSLIVVSLMHLGATKEVAEQNADAIEHVLSDEVYELLARHVTKGKEILSALN